MSLLPDSALLNLRLRTPSENQAQRRDRVSRSRQVARQMLSNGCSANTVARYTGLKEEDLAAL